MKRNFLFPLILLIMILALFAAVAAPAFAQGQNPTCVFVEGQGWHIVGGGQASGGGWYETQAACEIALLVPTMVATLSTNMPPTEETTLEPPTAVPTDGTPLPPTNEPTLEPTAMTEPPVTLIPPTEPTKIEVTAISTAITTYTPPAPPKRKGMSCERAWDKITSTVYERETGVRFFEKHKWCETWLWLKYGIDFKIYMAMHPLEN